MKFVLVLLLTNIFVFASAEPTRQLVLFLFRHGDRSPANPYPHYPNASYWTQGLGQLTTIGMQEQFELGQYIKQSYIPSFLSSAYRANETYIRSSDVDRTIMSAQTQLAAIFPPSGPQIWNPSLLWQPIPVHSVPAQYDNVLRAYGSKCPAYDDSVLQYRKSDDFIDMSSKYKALFAEISNAIQSEANLSNIWMYYDTVFCNKMHNLTLPGWAERNFQVLAYLNDYDLKISYARDEIQKYMAGRLWGYFWDLVNAKMNKSRDIKAYWLSSHDVTLVSFLSSLKVWNGRQPPYASLVISELMREGDNWYFNFYFKNSSEEAMPLYVPGCDKSSCSLDKLKDLTKKLTLSQEEWELACNEGVVRSFDLNALPYIISICILGIVILFLCFVWIFTIPCKIKRRDKRINYSILKPES